MKLYPPLLKWTGIEGLHHLAKRPDITISFSPFGREPGVVFTKAPPIMKGLAGRPLEEMARISPSHAAIVAGLRKAIDISVGKAGVYGTARVIYDGEEVRMPMKSAMQLKEGMFGRYLGARLKITPIKLVASKGTVRIKRLAPIAPPAPL